jgi:hypothetical protein
MDRIPNRSEKKSRCLCLTTGGADRLSLPERRRIEELAPFLVTFALVISAAIVNPRLTD